MEPKCLSIMGGQRIMLKETSIKIAAAILATAAIALSGISAAGAAAREEIAAVSVNAKGSNFRYWQKDSASLAKLRAYVKTVTDPKSPEFIPLRDRIAVFDVDGTLACETAPFCFDFLMMVDRALYDPSYTASEQDKANARDVERDIYAHKVTNETRVKTCASHASVFGGMTPGEYAAYTKKYLEKPVEGFSNLKIGEAYFLPMVEVLSYLRANEFKIFLVSGADREYTRVMAEVLPVDCDNILGTDYRFAASNQNGRDGMEYVFTTDDKVVRGEFEVKNINMNKVSVMAREIGRQPVLAFGNSGGDFSMYNYTTTNPRYKTIVFSLLADDTEREFGKPASAEKMLKNCEIYGWVPVSMKNEWKTIYGDHVKKSN